MGDEKLGAWDRRRFLKGTVLGLAGIPAARYIPLIRTEKKETAKVALIKTTERKVGVREALNLVVHPDMKGRNVVLKPNFNTSDPCPGSTYNDTLAQLVREIHDRGAASIALGERSGPPPTREVMEEKGIFLLAEELDFRVINYEELPPEDWIRFDTEGNHWNNGFSLARPAVEADYFVSTCCLKTHQYGGVFTMSLKLAVGLTPKTLMRELHGNREHMRRMIAEINLGYRPQLIILDGVEAFVDGGPSRGTRKRADVFLAGTDRVAVDAAGLAVLKELGSNPSIMETRIFDQEQIQRAVELGLGVSRPEQIEFVTPDRASREYASKLRPILARG